MEKQRRAFPSTFKALDGKRPAPTEADIDRMLFDMVRRWCGPAADPEPARPAVPTEAELRRQAKALGIRTPPPREGSAEWFRDDMLRLLDAGTGTSAAFPQRESTAPVRIATFEVI
jgi:hypothetical protein